MVEKDVILYSGGMDSYIGELFLQGLPAYSTKKLLPLYIDYKGSACNKEKEIVKNLNPQVQIIEDVLNLSGMEHGQDNLLFGRNMYFCLLAAPITDKYIYLLGLKNSKLPDNTAKFFEKASTVLSEIKGEEVVVCSPFVSSEHFPSHGMVKEEIVDWYFNNGYSLLYLLEHTSSCYFSEHMFCGECMGCFYFYCAVYQYIKNITPSKLTKWRNAFTNKELVKQELNIANSGGHFPLRAEAIREIAKDMGVS